MPRSLRTWQRTLLWCLPFVLGLLLLCNQIKSPANLYDEGLILVNAERVRAGEVPYRDFWTLYAPGYFYALAGLFSLVEPNILIARLFDTLLRFLLTVEVYLLARPLTSRWVALVPYALVTFWLSTIRFYSYPAFPATGAILLMALAFIRYLRGGRTRWLFVAGLALGATAILRLDFGGYAAIGFGFALACYTLRSGSDEQIGGKVRVMRLLKAELIMGAGALLVALPLYAYLAAAAGVGVLYEDLIHFPATIFRAMRHLPVPPLIPNFGKITGMAWNDWLRLYIPLATFAVALILAIRWLFVRPTPAADRRLIVDPISIALVGTGLGLTVKATSRYHELHALPMTICAVIVAMALIYRIPERLWRSAPFRVGFAGVAFLFLTSPYLLHFGILAMRSPTSPVVCYSSLPRSGCVLVSRDQERVAGYLQANTRPDEYVFIGNSRHDLIFVNDLLLYFLANRRSPTKYTELHPGLATTLPVQQAIANDLAAKDVQWVVMMKSWESNEPNASSISSGVTYLDDYIRANYRPETAFGNYQVWRR